MAEVGSWFSVVWYRYLKRCTLQQDLWIIFTANARFCTFL